MPQIHEYVAQESPYAEVGGRRATAEDFGGGIGEGLGYLGAGGRDLGNALFEVQQQTETTDVHTKLAQARAKWTLEMTKRADATGYDAPDFAEKFNSDFNADVQKIGEGITTRGAQQAFLRGSKDLAADMFAQAGAFQAKIAGIKAKQNYTQLVDANRNTLLNTPFQFEAIRQATLAALDDPNGAYAKVPAADRDVLKRTTQQDLALSAVQGLINMNPYQAKKELNSGKWDAYLDADKKFALDNSADAEIQSWQVDAERQQAIAQRALRRKQIEDGNKILAAILKDDPKAVQTIMASSLDPTGENGKLGWLKLAQSHALSSTNDTDPITYLSLFERIRLNPKISDAIKDESELNKYVGHGLSMRDFAALRTEFLVSRTPGGEAEAGLKSKLFDLAKRRLTGSNTELGASDPNGDDRYQKFLAYALEAYRTARNEGKSARDLLDPKSKDYLGNDIEQFARPRAQAMHDTIFQNEGAPIRVANDADFEKLAPGTRFVGPDGKVRVKK